MWLPSHAVDVVVSGSRLERRTVVGESPVSEDYLIVLGMLISRAIHEKSCLNMGGPSSKAKYSSSTDSGQVP